MKTTRILFETAGVPAEIQTGYLSKMRLIFFPTPTILEWTNKTKLYFPRDGGSTGLRFHFN